MVLYDALITGGRLEEKKFIHARMHQRAWLYANKFVFWFNRLWATTPSARATTPSTRDHAVRTQPLFHALRSATRSQTSSHALSRTSSVSDHAVRAHDHAVRARPRHPRATTPSARNHSFMLWGRQHARSRSATSTPTADGDTLACGLVCNLCTFLVCSNSSVG